MARRISTPLNDRRAWRSFMLRWKAAIILLRKN